MNSYISLREHKINPLDAPNKRKKQQKVDATRRESYALRSSQGASSREFRTECSAETLGRELTTQNPQF
jgi:hypothetical protein